MPLRDVQDLYSTDLTQETRVLDRAYYTALTRKHELRNYLISHRSGIYPLVHLDQVGIGGLTE